MGRIEALCISDKKGTTKTVVERATMLTNLGLEGDAHAGSWHRQISLLDVRDIERMRAKGMPDLAYGAFGENLVLEGIDLNSLGLGSRIRIGEKVELRITQRGKVCHHHCVIYETTGDCIMPRNGLFARVEEGGEIHAGDDVTVEERVDPLRYQTVVLTISDKGSRGEREDTAGPAVSALLEEGLGAYIYAREILPDDQRRIEGRLRHYSHGHNIDLVVAVGGTGFTPKDVTPEAVRNVVERLTPGLDEAMRAASLQKTSHAILSRACSGIREQTLILSVPGSKRASVENLESILKALPHGLKKLRGDPSDCAVPETEERKGAKESSKAK